ncbi:MAG: hypothetical protein NZM43_04030 [Saprospiraceae bacterium]|nr:hypothetical protein [Saprospiraceae bacterium]MDW8483475.1 hypothetical protein [Saprospiraceae bacterium]
MTKKRFSKGLDDLLQQGGETTTATLSGGENLSSVQERRNNTAKNFARNLESLLNEAMSPEEDPSESEGHALGSGSQMPLAQVRARGAGIYALIRPTEAHLAGATDSNANLKRLTITLERTKLEKLRAIARKENTYLKDLLQRAIDEYLKKFDLETAKTN